jgi:hypothetical protein
MKPEPLSETPPAPAEPAPKPLLKSKTVVVNLVLAALALLPQAQDLLRDNASDAIALVTALNVVLRLVTKRKIALWGNGQ